MWSCPCCGVMFESYTKKNKPKIYCSPLCNGRHNSIKSREKAKQTCLERHGVEHPMHINESKEKTKRTNLERHGTTHVMYLDEFKEKTKKTNLERRGVEYALQSKEVREKIKKTNIERHGVDYFFMSEIFKEKAKQTCLERHGADHPMRVDKFKDKAKKTNMILRGVEYSSQSAEVKEKAKKTNIILYGVEYPSQAEEIKEKKKQTSIFRRGTTSWSNRHISIDLQNKLDDVDWLKEKNATKSLTEIAYELNINPLILSRRFKQHEISVKHHISSLFEKQVYKFVKSIYPNIIPNDRKQIKPYELDIWFPDLNLAIECNGRYFHQDQEREQNKIDRCKEKNIDLYFIWDDEWYADTEKEKERIRNIISTHISDKYSTDGGKCRDC